MAEPVPTAIHYETWAPQLTFCPCQDMRSQPRNLHKPLAMNNKIYTAVNWNWSNKWPCCRKISILGFVNACLAQRKLKFYLNEDSTGEVSEESWRCSLAVCHTKWEEVPMLLLCPSLPPRLLEGTNQTKWRLLCLTFTSCAPLKYRTYLANIFHMFRGQTSCRRSQVSCFVWPLPAVYLGEDFLVLHDSTHHSAEAWGQLCREDAANWILWGEQLSWRWDCSL